MTKQDLRIVYMGTPEFAVESLKRLIETGYNIVGVVTMPDKPMGRHQDTLSMSAVKTFALAHNLKVLQPDNLKSEAFVSELRALNADLQIVVAFRMLPEIVWNMPRLGTFNLHASLLPQYRGAAPINWAIINGETETGVTSFFLQHEIDTGHIIMQERVPIADTDNVGVVYDRLMTLGADVVVKTVEKIISNTVKLTPQVQVMPANLKPAPKIFKDTCKLSLDLDVKRAYDFIRGLSPYPAAWAELKIDNKTQPIKLFAAEKEFVSHSDTIGCIFVDAKKGLRVALSDGYLWLTVLQPAGKKRMKATDFARGLRTYETITLL